MYNIHSQGYSIQHNTHTLPLHLLAAQQHAIHHCIPLHSTQPPSPLPSPNSTSHPSLPLSLPLSPHSPCPARRARRRAEGTRTGGIRAGTRRDTEGYGQRHLCNCICTRVAGASEERVAVDRVPGGEYSGEHRKCMYRGQVQILAFFRVVSIQWAVAFSPTYML